MKDEPVTVEGQPTWPDTPNAGKLYRRRLCEGTMWQHQQDYGVRNSNLNMELNYSILWSSGQAFRVVALLPCRSSC